MIESVSDVKKELKYTRHYVWLGLKDYLKDTKHDWLLKQLYKRYPKLGFKDGTNRQWFTLTTLKEGNLRHYVHQRKEAYKRKRLVLDFCISTGRIE